MRKTLLSSSILDVVYYTHGLFCAALMANGDCEYVPYLLLLDAAASEKAATPKELARILGEDRHALEFAADHWESEGLLIRTRSPLDRRAVAFLPTLMGKKHAYALNQLMADVCSRFWQMDGSDTAKLITTLEPFRPATYREWPRNDEIPASLSALCALHSLWKDYTDFSHKNILTFSEMHLLLAMAERGGLPNRPLYKNRNQFSINDLATLTSLAQEKRLVVETHKGLFELTDRGKAKIAILFERLDAPAKNKHVRNDEHDDPSGALLALCTHMVAHATADNSV